MLYPQAAPRGVVFQADYTMIRLSGLPSCRQADRRFGEVARSLQPDVGPT